MSITYRIKIVKDSDMVEYLVNQKYSEIFVISEYFFGASSGIRTPDTLLKRQVLCQLS